MQIADLYIRVSTDEQADKGYSQRSQEETLKKYCELKGIRIRKIVFEDHSAKTFNRPAWMSLMLDLKKTKGRHSDLILFTKWDRFSRNAGDAYQVINELKKLGIEPQAIEQPLDISIPENKIMLAFYLAAPEVENDRRALNVLVGMRRARKEGRWMASAPIGYINRSFEDGRKYIAPKEPEASILKWAFEKIAEGHFSTEQVWKCCREKGLKCGKNNFLLAVRNPVYCGKIRVPKYKDEEEMVVDGLHEPLITENLFCKMQVALDKRSRQTPGKQLSGTTITTPKQLPLRGFLVCPNCGRMLTGSPSKGRNQYYFYYHCSTKCGWRHKSEIVNEAFLKQIKEFEVRPGMTEIVSLSLREKFYDDVSQKKDGRKDLVNQINLLTDKLSIAREHLMNEVIDAADYRIIKLDCDNKIKGLEAQLSELPKNAVTGEDVINTAVTALSQLEILFNTDDMDRKRMVIGSMFPEKLWFDGAEHRTTRLNDGARVMYQINSELQKKKRRASNDNSYLPSWVRPPGLEPGTKRL
ncbi:MAG TPA: recombinase family protein [Mucilaginibacter sp.]